jgi:hypothetical protein
MGRWFSTISCSLISVWSGKLQPLLCGEGLKTDMTLACFYFLLPLNSVTSYLLAA